MIVAGLQLDIVWERPDENFRRAETAAEAAIASGARLLVLPEMFATGFTMNAAAAVAAAEAARAFLAGLARGRGVWVVGGYADTVDGRPRNRCALVSPQGTEALLYDKLHPFTLAGEDQHYAAGDDLPTARVDDVRLTALICYDLRFPEPFRAAAADTDLFVVPANWPVTRSFAWRTLLIARAIENQAYVLGVNRVGEGDGLHYRGDTMLVDPRGEVVATASLGPASIVGEVDPGRVRADRERFGFLSDRRPELYENLARR